jgi:hypothetical protein
MPSNRLPMLGQQLACPLDACGKPLQMNPFVVDGREGDF